MKKVDIEELKIKLLSKYSVFGSVIAKLKFVESKSVGTAGTDGRVVYYNPDFLGRLTEKQQIFLLAHEVCHVAFGHILRGEGKDKLLWNIATDAVINALLKKDKLEFIDGIVDIPEAINYDAEEMYNKLLEEKRKQEEQKQEDEQKEQEQEGQEQKDGQEGQEQEGQEQKDGQEGQEQEDEQEGQEQKDGQKGRKQHGKDGSKKQNGKHRNQEQKSEDGQEREVTDVGHDTHSFWERAIEDSKKEQSDKEDDGKPIQEPKFEELGEREVFRQNAEERKKRLQEFSRELIQETFSAGDEKATGEKKLSDIGIAAPLIDWRRLLKQATRYNEEYTRKNARMRNGFFTHRVEQIPFAETEIVLDTSGSVSEVLLRNFLRECKSIFGASKIKVGCFDTEFHGFTEIRKPEDIDNMKFPIGGGTDFNAAVGAFSRRATNKIIFTDGYAPMPEEEARNVIWVVFGVDKINPKGGKVIYISEEQLRRLYHAIVQDKDDKSK